MSAAQWSGQSGHVLGGWRKAPGYLQLYSVPNATIIAYLCKSPTFSRLFSKHSALSHVLFHSGCTAIVLGGIHYIEL